MVLVPAAQTALWDDLVGLQTRHNTSGSPDVTEARAEYLEIVAVRDPQPAARFEAAPQRPGTSHAARA